MLVRARNRFRNLPWVLTILVGGGALAVSATMIASRLLLPSERALIPTQTWPWQTDGVGVDAIGVGSPFRAGDVVIAVDGRPLADWAGAIFSPWSSLAPAGTSTPGSTPSSMAVDVIRDGQKISFDAPLGAFPAERLTAAPLGLVAFGSVALVLAIVLLVRRPQTTALRLLFVGVCANTADIVAWEFGLQPSDIVLRTPFAYAFGLAAVFNLIFWACLLHILLIYPVRSGFLTRHPRAIVAIYGGPVAALAMGALVARLAGGSILDWFQRLAPVVGATASAMLVLILTAIAAGYRRTPVPRRPKVRTLAITLSVAAGAVLLLTTLPIALTGRPLVARSTVAFLALPAVLALAVAVIRDRLFQVDLLATSRRRIVAAREEERRRLRRELHDGLGPNLAAIGLKVDLAREHAVDDPAATAILDEVRADLRAVIGQIRSLARELRPPALDSLGLEAAVRQQIEAMVTAGGPHLRLDVSGLVDRPPLPAAVEVAAYRIVVEAVANAVRHSGAEHCDATIEVADRTMEIRVEDDGAGMIAEPLGVGTRSMYERAAEVGGELLIEPRSPHGTVVHASIPLAGIGRIVADSAPAGTVTPDPVSPARVRP